jgi:two-component system NarL family sensor kinase
VFEIRLWDKDGRIVYSEDPKLIGQTFGLPHEAQEILDGGDVPANLETQKDEVNTPNVENGELVEVYVPVVAPDGQKLVFEC